MPDPVSVWTRSLVLAAGLLLACASVGAAEKIQDGPYVTRGPGGQWLARWVEGDGATLKVRQEKVATGEEVSVAGVGDLPAFRVKLREPGGAAPDVVSLPGDAPLFVVADTHGEFEIAVGLLRRHGIIDEALRWSFGDGHLAILGDVFDRGPHQTELLWLIYKLEAEAATAGGGVHFMLGNHETLALLGDDRYLNPKYVRVAAALKAPRYAALWDEQTLLGQWLRSKSAVMKLGTYLCMHGGISRELVDRGLTIASVNRSVRQTLSGHEGSPAGLAEFVMGRAGPLWYRGYFAREAREGGYTIATPEDIDAILDAFKVDRILVGHTKVPAVTPLFDGRVIAVQVYPHRDQATGAPIMEALLIRQGRLFRARADGSTQPLTP